MSMFPELDANRTAKHPDQVLQQQVFFTSVFYFGLFLLEISSFSCISVHFIFKGVSVVYPFPKVSRGQARARPDDRRGGRARARPRDFFRNRVHHTHP
jgi:hypothetical protein